MSQPMPVPMPEQPPMIQPQPLPLQVFIDQAQTVQGPSLVVLKLITPQGMSVFFLDPDSANAVARDLKRNAAGARSGLITPNGGGLIL